MLRKPLVMLNGLPAELPAGDAIVGARPGEDGAGLTWRGAWSNVTAYVINDVVEHEGSSYIAVAGNTNSEPPSANWELVAAKGQDGEGEDGEDGASFIWRGPWSNLTAYVVNDVVEHEGSSYIAVAPSTGSEPPSADWELMAAKGEDGEGEDGDDGQGFTWRGAWDIGTAYAAYDLVEHEGSSYITLSPTTGDEPPAAPWELVAAKGEDGEADDGEDGADGVHGGAITIEYAFSTTTTNSDPGPGVMRYGAATFVVATPGTLRLDDVDAHAVDWQTVYATFDDSTSTTKGYIRLQHETDPTKWVVLAVTSATEESGYWNIGVTPVGVSGAAPFADADPMVVLFSPNGDKGTTGDAGDDAYEWFINVLDHGATGDGVTDDTAAIQAAWAEAALGPIKTVFFPPGTYLVHGVASAYNGFDYAVNYDGEELTVFGDNATVLLDAHDGTLMFTFMGATGNITFRSMKFAAPTTMDTNHVSPAAISVGEMGSGASDQGTLDSLKIVDCEFNLLGRPIHGTGVKYFHCLRSKLNQLGGGAYPDQVDQVIGMGSLDDGDFMTDTFIVEDCDIEAHTTLGNHAIYLLGKYGSVIIKNNRFTATHDDTIKLYAGQDDADWPSDGWESVLVEGNTFQGASDTVNTSYIVVLSSDNYCTNFTMRDNTVIGSCDALCYSEWKLDHALVQGNTCKAGVRQQAIQFITASDFDPRLSGTCQILDNHIGTYSTGGSNFYGIRVSFFDDVTFANNTLEPNGTGDSFTSSDSNRVVCIGNHSSKTPLWVDDPTFQSGVIDLGNQWGTSQIMNWRGDWLTATLYLKGDVVRYAECLWIAQKATTSFPPLLGELETTWEKVWGELSEAIMVEDDFSGAGSSDLHGTAADIGGTWSANLAFDDDGTCDAIGSGSGAFQLVSIENGHRYLLQWQLRDKAYTGTTLTRLGFFKGPASPNTDTGTDATGNANPTTARWMAQIRGNSGNNLYAISNLTGVALTNSDFVTEYGDLDVMLELDTTPGTGNWTGRVFCKLPADTEWQACSGVVALGDEDITAVGIVAANTNGAHKSDYFKLSRWSSVGAAGGSGVFGGAMSFLYQFSTTTTDSDPGTGTLRLDNATQNTSGNAILDLVDLHGVTITDALDSLNNFGANFSTRFYTRIVKANDTSKFILWKSFETVTETGYRKIFFEEEVASSEASPFANGDEVVITFTPVGTKGDAGLDGANALGLTGTATKTTTYTANVGELVRCDTSGGAFTVTMPASPSIGDVVGAILITAGNKLTISRAGSQVFRGINLGSNTSIQLQSAGSVFLFVYGATNEWTIIGDTRLIQLARAFKTANYTALPNEFVFCDISSGGFTVDLPNDPLGDTRVGVKLQTGSTSNTLTIRALSAGGGSIISNGANIGNTLVIQRTGEYVELEYTGSNFWQTVSEIRNTLPTIQVFAASGSYTLPTNAVSVEVHCIAGGGGGGAGRRGATSTARFGGGGGGGGEYRAARLTAATVGTSPVTVTVGGGGAGGTYSGTNDQNGGNGGTGGTTSFGSHCVATGGGAGQGGSTTAGTAGAGGSGGTGSLANANGGAGGAGGGGGGNGTSGSQGATTQSGAGGGGGWGLVSDNATIRTGGFGGTGAGLGGQWGTAVTIDGFDGQTAPSFASATSIAETGGGGGGGGSSNYTAITGAFICNGGRGGKYGGGGGGGGGTTNSTSSFANGQVGGAGVCIVITFFN